MGKKKGLFAREKKSPLPLRPPSAGRREEKGGFLFGKKRRKGGKNLISPRKN